MEIPDCVKRCFIYLRKSTIKVTATKKKRMQVGKYRRDTGDKNGICNYSGL